jgi:hypothetical protein
MGGAMDTGRKWTIYLAQDKHLDYNWCGSTSEIEARMAALVDYYLDQVELMGSRWNLDGTIWLDVYRRQRGEAGAGRLLDAIRRGHIGYGANQAVLLWGMLSAELGIRACYGSLSIEQTTRTPNQTVLVMENAGLPWSVASVLTECGFLYLGRGIYDLRAKSYVHQREPYPLFWWIAPDGRRLLVRWDLYEETRSWGGYAEAFKLASLAGEEWDAFHVRRFGDRNTAEVYRQRVAYINDTVRRYEAYGEIYPISSILLLGTGWDNWTCTPDYVAFVQRFNAQSDGRIRLVDARYEEFFEAALSEIDQRGLELPVQEGSFGICWEEWPAHLAGPTADWRRAERLLRLAEASHAICSVEGELSEAARRAIRQGFDALLRFAEHDFGGCDRTTAAISAGVRAAAATEALSIGRALCPDTVEGRWPALEDPVPENLSFTWRGACVLFDRERGAVASLVDETGREWVPQKGSALGEFHHTVYQMEESDEVFPPSIPVQPCGRVDRVSCQRGRRGIAVCWEGERYGFGLATHWFFHAAHPWLDIRYNLAGGWSEHAQSVQICFPLSIDDPVYRYDTGGVMMVAGPASEGGHDLPGANPFLYAVQTFCAVHGGDVGVVVLTPDAYLARFGRTDRSVPPAEIVSMPMMNLTRNDWQFGQGGRREWTFCYRLVWTGRYDPLQVVREAQQYGVPPYLQVPGEEAVLPGLGTLEVAFEGGPVVALKVAEDGKRLILRLWNVLDRPVQGTARLPEGFVRAEQCDALERRIGDMGMAQGRVVYTVSGRAIGTVAFCRA